MTEQKKSLSRQVAEAVGWYVEWNHPAEVADGFYELHKPNGQIVAYGNDETEALNDFPDFEHDANACITALDATGGFWKVDSSYILGKRRYSILALGGDAHGTDFCKVACKILIQWRKWKDKQKSTTP